MKIEYKKSYRKSFSKLDKRIKEKAIERIAIFIRNPFEPILNNHALIWNLQWKRSINITWDYRAIFIEHSNWTYEFVEFTDFWTHSQLY